MNSNRIILPRKRTGSKVAAGCLGLFGLFMLLGFLVIVSGSDQTDMGTSVFSLIVGLVGIVGAAWWVRWIIRMERDSGDDLEDKVVLKVAERHGGMVSVALVTVETHLTTDEARVTLERLCTEGLAYPEIQDDGGVLYRFAGLVRRPDAG